MSFKQIQHTITTANTDQTIYTVPTGKEYVVFGTRARSNNTGKTITFKQGSTTFSTLTTSSENGNYGWSGIKYVTISDPLKIVLSAGTVVKARSTQTNDIAEVFGLELNAGTWATVGTNLSN